MAVAVSNRSAKGEVQARKAKSLTSPPPVRIMIYKHPILDQKCNIAKRSHGHRLPSQIHVHFHVTRWICQPCLITAVVDITMPPVTTP